MKVTAQIEQTPSPLGLVCDIKSVDNFNPQFYQTIRILDKMTAQNIVDQLQTFITLKVEA